MCNKGEDSLIKIAFNNSFLPDHAKIKSFLPTGKPTIGRISTIGGGLGLAGLGLYTYNLYKNRQGNK